jgi:uncharacterized protein YjhX (UPF0386 family)
MLDKELEFLSTAKRGSAIELVEFLKAPNDLINTCDEYGNNVLHKAAEGGNKENFFLLLENKIPINSRNKNNTTVLHFAAQGGNVDIVQYCLDEGIDINARNKTEQTPIHFAAKGGQLEIIKMLNSKGADLHVEDSNGLTALNCAVNSKNENVINYLKENGVKMGVKLMKPAIPQEIKPSLSINVSSQRAKREFSQSLLVTHELGKYKREIEKLEGRVNQLQETCGLQANEINHLMDKLTKAYEKIKLLKDKSSLQKRENEELKEENDLLKAQVERSDKQCSRAQTVISTYNKILNKKKDTNFADKFANKEKQQERDPSDK